MDIQSFVVANIIRIMEEIAPPELAESWDRIGLQIGNPSQPVRRVLLALDITDAVLKAAVAQSCSLIICHHPPIFQPLDALRLDNPAHQLIVALASRPISVYAAHTNLDAAPGGVADVLAARLIGALPADPVAVTTGSGSQPAVNRYGRLLALRQPITLNRLAAGVRQALGSPSVQLNTDQDRPVRCIAAFPGSFAVDGQDLRAASVDAVVCGEYKYHEGLLLAAGGIALIAAGHELTERIVLQPLAQRLAEKLPQIPFAVYPGLDYNRMAF